MLFPIFLVVICLILNFLAAYILFFNCPLLNQVTNLLDHYIQIFGQKIGAV